MASMESNDIDVFVSVRKANANSKVLRNINIPLEDLKIKSPDIPLISQLACSHRTQWYSSSQPPQDRHSAPCRQQHI